MRQDYSALELPVQATLFDNVQRAMGSFDRFALVEDGLDVVGWMLLPDTNFDFIQVYLDGKPQDLANVVLREDLGKRLTWVPHAKWCGFKVRLSRSMVKANGVGRLDLLGCKDNRSIARMSTLFRTDLDDAVPTPPPKLMDRVAATQDPRLFKVQGINCFGELLEPICRHRDIRFARRLLDWGCGCGRVTAHFLMLRDGPEVFGCDIDAEAVAWCSEHLVAGAFATIDPWPPTPYEDAAFDLVISYSVFTHLAREAQNAWLEEMRRIIAPGGLFLASTQGEFAALFGSPDTLTMVLHNGIYDERLDPKLNEIAPEGYYRSVYQTREYTTREWSKYFEILEYLEPGIGLSHDLVVMQRSL